MSSNIKIVSLTNNAPDWCTISLARDENSSDTISSGNIVSAISSMSVDVNVDNKYWVVISTVSGVYSIVCQENDDGESWVLSIIQGGDPITSKNGYNSLSSDDSNINSIKLIFQLSDVDNDAKLDLNIVSDETNVGGKTIEAGQPYLKIHQS